MYIVRYLQPVSKILRITNDWINMHISQFVRQCQYIVYITKANVNLICMYKSTAILLKYAVYELKPCIL